MKPVLETYENNDTQVPITIRKMYKVFEKLIPKTGT